MSYQTINLQQALENLDNDTELIGELAEVLLCDLPKQVEKLNLAVKEMDATQIRFWAHSIKGAVGNVCAEKCQAIALKMECLGKDETIDTIESELKNFNEAYEELLPKLKELTDRYK